MLILRGLNEAIITKKLTDVVIDDVLQDSGTAFSKRAFNKRLQEGTSWDEALRQAFMVYAESTTGMFNNLFKTAMPTEPMTWHRWQQVVHILQEYIVAKWNELLGDTMNTRPSDSDVDFNEHTDGYYRKSLLYFTRRSVVDTAGRTALSYVDAMVHLNNDIGKIPLFSEIIMALTQYFLEKIAIIKKNRKMINSLLQKLDMDIKIKTIGLNLEIVLTFCKPKITVFDSANSQAKSYEVSLEDNPFGVGVGFRLDNIMHYFYHKIIECGEKITVDKRMIKNVLKAQRFYWGYSLSGNQPFHPYINSRQGEVCLGTWEKDIREALVTLNIPHLIMLFKGWSQAYDIEHQPFHSITYFYRGIPKAYGKLGRHIGTDMGLCRADNIAMRYCRQIDCQVKSRCRHYKVQAKLHDTVEEVPEDSPTVTGSTSTEYHMASTAPVGSPIASEDSPIQATWYAEDSVDSP